MSVSLGIENGEIVSGLGTTSSDDSSSSSTTDNTIDSDMFLSLLVAEMQYQDPLEPTSNTEWVSQYATFTQVEQIDEMTTEVKESYAADLVGKTLIVIDESSSTGYASGQVDYVYREDGEIYLAIGDGLYTLDQIDSIVDDDYLDALSVAQTFESMVSSIPDADSVTASDKPLVAAARTAYDSMTTYQKQFVDSDTLSTFTEIEEAIAPLVADKFATMMGAIDLDNLTTDDADAITEAREYYDSMTDSMQEAVASDDLEKLEAAEEAIAALTED